MAVQDVIGEVSGSQSGTAMHAGASKEVAAPLSQKRFPTPFLSFEMGAPLFNTHDRETLDFKARLFFFALIF
jgi:hypothetical protein